MQKSTKNQLTNRISKLTGVKEVQTTEAKVQDHADYLCLDKVFNLEKGDAIEENKKPHVFVRKTSKKVGKKKLLTSGSSILGYLLIAFSAIAFPPTLLNPDNFTLGITIRTVEIPVGLYVISALLACFAFYFSGKTRSHSISVSEKEILDNSDTLNITPRDLEILNLIRDGKIVIFGKDIDGHFWEYSPGILKTENWRIFLLLGVEAKSVLFLDGWFPSKGLYILKSDYLKLQQALVVDTTTETEKNITLSTESVLKSSKATLVPAINQNKFNRKKEREKQTAYKRPKILDELPKNTRFSPFLKCLLWKKSNVEKFIRKAKKANALSPARTRYFNAILYCFENWSTWKLYLKGVLKGDAQKNFEEELLFHLKGSIKFKQTDAELLKKFVTADMRSLDAWIEELEIVPSEDIIKVTTNYLNLKNKNKK